jgi:hypothetical protein
MRNDIGFEDVNAFIEAIPYDVVVVDVVVIVVTAVPQRTPVALNRTLRPCFALLINVTIVAVVMVIVVVVC